MAPGSQPELEPVSSNVALLVGLSQLRVSGLNTCRLPVPFSVEGPVSIAIDMGCAGFGTLLKTGIEVVGTAPPFKGLPAIALDVVFAVNVSALDVSVWLDLEVVDSPTVPACWANQVRNFTIPPIEFSGNQGTLQVRVVSRAQDQTVDAEVGQAITSVIELFTEAYTPVLPAVLTALLGDTVASTLTRTASERISNPTPCSAAVAMPPAFEPVTAAMFAVAAATAIVLALRVWRRHEIALLSLDDSFEGVPLLNKPAHADDAEALLLNPAVSPFAQDPLISAWRLYTAAIASLTVVPRFTDRARAADIPSGICVLDGGAFRIVECCHRCGSCSGNDDRR